MFTTKDFISKYENYTDDELVEIYNHISGYSQEAQEGLKIVIQNKGGYDALLKRLEERQILTNEAARIAKETAEFGSQGIDASFIKKMISSTILSPEKVNEIIDSEYSSAQMALEDKKIKPRTVFGSIIGGGIASLVGGVLWGLQIIYSKRIYYILFFGLVLLCYGIIRLFTKQSKKNTVVLAATIISVILSLVIGQLLYQIVGYKEF
ncbi:MAG: hypothetical protein Q8927_15280 [Bacteroidota bacterium]|nr:hypothetical protein [Bacteroidota bacterium]MDP4247520.1 hypothetical protein [Bacteroidota bacterium]MDP4254673.1 hypothetical protein [Bacteroidota bacterium]MDP4260268.1 hypothetical protein [Bacteroidota bacterium]